MSLLPRTFRSLLGALGALGVLLWLGCHGADTAPVVHSTQPRHDAVRLVVLHTGDWHGYAFASQGKRGRFGGVVAAAAAVRRERRALGDRVLVLDAGDLLSGPPAVGLRDERGIEGAPFVRLWQMVGWDAVELGNHEFDAGRDNLEALIGILEPTVLCANLVTATAEPGAAPLPRTGAIPGTVRWTVLRRGGVRVAILGLITSELPSIVARKPLEGLATLPAIAAARRLMPALERISDVQLVLSHCGIEEDREIARAVPGIEAILGGHSHTTLRRAEVVNGVPILHAGPHGRHMGRLELVVAGTGDDRHVVRWDWQLLDLPRTPEIEADTPPALLEAERALRRRVEALEREVVGRLPQRLTRAYYTDSPLGGAVCEALRAATHADVALVNSGGLRSDLGPGPVTVADLVTAFPFGNAVVRAAVRGDELRRIIAHNLRVLEHREHGMLQASGYQVRYRVGPAGAIEILSIRIGDRPLDPAARYVVASSDYVFTSQPHKYLGTTLAPVVGSGLTVREAVQAAIERGRFAPPAAARHVRVGAPARAPAAATR
ncbi:MAG: bifunctional metallophosphatase/5'-nucleotidase [Planctomycetota bacterium]|nr:MAG: bifunctional metallophosphatase/5'-nucleotidase [Planctomycetota bacterium]